MNFTALLFAQYKARCQIGDLVAVLFISEFGLEIIV